MNIKQIVNDPELYRELCKAYQYAAPYRSKVQYKLALINACQTVEFWGTQQQAIIRNKNFYDGFTTCMIDASMRLAHPDLLV